MSETQSKTGVNVEEVADRIRELNERIIDSSKQAGEGALSAYAKALESIAELQEMSQGQSARLDHDVRHRRGDFTRDLAEAYTAAARKLVK